MYGALALGHAADLEADRLYNKMIRQLDANRLMIHIYAGAMRLLSHGILWNARETHSRIWADITARTSSTSFPLYPCCEGVDIC